MLRLTALTAAIWGGIFCSSGEDSVFFKSGMNEIGRLSCEKGEYVINKWFSCGGTIGNISLSCNGEYIFVVPYLLSNKDDYPVYTVSVNDSKIAQMHIIRGITDVTSVRQVSESVLLVFGKSITDSFSSSSDPRLFVYDMASDRIMRSIEARKYFFLSCSAVAYQGRSELAAGLPEWKCTDPMRDGGDVLFRYGSSVEANRTVCSISMDEDAIFVVSAFDGALVIDQVVEKSLRRITSLDADFCQVVGDRMFLVHMKSDRSYHIIEILSDMKAIKDAKVAVSISKRDVDCEEVTRVLANGDIIEFYDCGASKWMKVYAYNQSDKSWRALESVPSGDLSGRILTVTH